MKGEIIAIGDELTSGRILNTTSSFAAGHLFAAGHDVLAMATVGDDFAAIETALHKALGRAEFIIITGGLGATSDDLTNETVAKVLGRPTTFYPEILTRITRKDVLAGGCVGNGRHPLEKLAWLPHGSRVLKPEANMAGHLLEHDGLPIFFLPGVPHEMKELMIDCVLPYLAARQTAVRLVRQKVYKIFGLQESAINLKLKKIEDSYPYIRIGYYPVYPEVHVSLTVHGESEQEIEALFNRFDIDIVSLLSPYIFGANNDTMESVVGALLRSHGQTLAVAESCTGGLVSRRLTRVPGASDYFPGAVIAYANAVKEKVLGVPAAVLTAEGAVSAATARAMATGVRALTGADLAVAITGIAGPGGGSEEKPVGLVWFGLADAAGARTFSRHFRGERWQVQASAGQTALDLVRRTLLGELDDEECARSAAALDKA